MEVEGERKRDGREGRKREREKDGGRGAEEVWVYVTKEHDMSPPTIFLIMHKHVY